MIDSDIPRLEKCEIEDGLFKAHNSERSRYPKLLHQPGDEFNRVFNFILRGSYMQPHQHPGNEKIEKIHLVDGKLATIFFNDQGSISDIVVLEKGCLEVVTVPAFAWHTYVALTDSVITYETMLGVYDVKTWKRYATFAPPEGSIDCLPYLESLRDIAEAKSINS
jgi:cupin fold WbuC family metalloprotein